MVKKTSDKGDKKEQDFPQFTPDDAKGTSRAAPAPAATQSQSTKRHSSKKKHRRHDDDMQQKKRAAAGRPPKEDSTADVFPHYMPDHGDEGRTAHQSHSTQRHSKKKHHHYHEDDDDMHQKKMAAAGRPKQDYMYSDDFAMIPADTAIPYDDQLKEEEKKGKRAAATSGVARRAPRNTMERLKNSKGSTKSIPGEDGKMPAVAAAADEVQDNSGPSSSAARVPRPRPPVRDVTPGAFAVDGVNGPSEATDIDDNTVYVGERYPSYEAATASATSQALDAHLVGENPNEDQEEFEGIIEDLENSDNIQVEAIVSDEDRPFWKKRSTRIGLVLVLVIVIIGVVVGSVVATRPSPPEPLASNETVSPAPTLMPSASPSLSPTTTEFTNFVAFLANASLDDGAALQDSTSPQYQAAQWLYDNENLSEYADAQRIQRYALAVLYYSTNGENWLQKTDWLSNEPECDWFNKGVTFCDAVSNGVANFDLNENNLVGALPPELYMLAGSVTSLIFSGNTLSGQLPTELGLLTKLTSLNNFGLNLNSNEIVGTIPSELGRLVGAGIFNLGGNNITGPVVSELGLLRATKELDLGTNKLDGPIPVEIYNILSLSELSLAGNSLTGTIDANVGLMTNLVDLNMGNNELQGTIPSEVGSLVRLQSLKFDNNQLTSTVPPEVSQLSQLGTLWLHENDLSGPYTCPARDVISDCRVSCSSSTNDACRTLE